MGVQGLLRELRPAARRRHLSEYRGQTVAVDAATWLYRGLYSCAVEVAQGRPTDRYARFVVARCKMMLHHGVTPLLVFDGQRSPLKRCEQTSRYAQRATALEEAERLVAMSQSLPPDSDEIDEVWERAVELYRRAIRITPEIVLRTVAAARAAGVEALVAPFEADPQLVELCRAGRCAAVLTEDSDVCVYAVVAGGGPPVLTKLDAGSGEVSELRLDDLAALSAAEGKMGTFVRALRPFADAPRMFVQMCVLAGCDYLPSLPGVGLITAQKWVLKYRLAPPERRVERIVRFLQSSKKTPVPPDYVAQAAQAERLFRWHYVLAEGDRVQHFTPPDADVDLAFLGHPPPAEAVAGVAQSELHPETFEPLPPPPPPAPPSASAPGFSPPAAGLRAAASAPGFRAPAPAPAAAALPPLADIPTELDVTGGEPPADISGIFAALRAPQTPAAAAAPAAAAPRRPVAPRNNPFEAGFVTASTPLPPTAVPAVISPAVGVAEQTADGRPAKRAKRRKSGPARISEFFSVVRRPVE